MNVPKTLVKMEQHAPTLTEATRVLVTEGLLERTAIKVCHLYELLSVT